MSGWNRPTAIEKIPSDQKLWFISDLHLGDGTPSDVFFGKDKHLMALVSRAEREGAVLVVVGDAMDFHQAWTFTRVLRAHQELLGAMSRLARQGRLFYVVGNHDYDISLYRQILNFRVCDELHVGDRILVQHGYEYDPYIGAKLEGSHVATKVHHLIERYLNTWLRIPLGEFYTFGNRVAFWTVHKLALALYGYGSVMRALGFPRSLEWVDWNLDYWARSNMGDPMLITRPILRRLREDRWPFIVCGHSHLPGVISPDDAPGRAYVNTGSWTFASSHYVTWDGLGFRCRDWITGREFRDELYQPLLDGTIDEKDFWVWWRENYMGWLRFREGEERRGRLRGWESYIRDHQALAQLEIPTLRPIAPAEQAPVETGLVDDTADPRFGGAGALRDEAEAKDKAVS